ncbi:hypothetical protein VCHC17A1_1052A, partial [Vibrio cholerae HC-17A1]
MVVME